MRCVYLTLKLTLVRVFLLQGKSSRSLLKNRTSLPKPLSRKTKIRSAPPIPLDRKENVQATSSKSGLKFNKFKAKIRKDITLKSKNSTEKSKTGKTVKKAALNSAKKAPVEVAPNTEGAVVPAEKLKDEGVHLKEIRFIKNSEGKAVIAKYDTKDYDDSLVVAWERNASKGQLFTRSSRVASATQFNFGNRITFSEPGTSRQINGFRVHNFTKPPSKTKLRKNLRRLASAADVLGKVDKKNLKKKLKSK